MNKEIYSWASNPDTAVVTLASVQSLQSELARLFILGRRVFLGCYVKPHFHCDHCSLQPALDGFCQDRSVGTTYEGKGSLFYVCHGSNLVLLVYLFEEFPTTLSQPPALGQMLQYRLNGWTYFFKWLSSNAISLLFNLFFIFFSLFNFHFHFDYRCKCI